MKKMLVLGLAACAAFAACKKKEPVPSVEINEPLSPTQLITMPVVFHILHNGTAVGFGTNPAAARVERLLDGMNRCFSGSVPGSFNSFIQFRMATTGPDGNALAERGIDRVNIQSERVNFDTLIAKITWKHELIWNPDQYINVFLVNSDASGIGGFATLPFRSPFRNIPGLSAPVSLDWASNPYNQGIYLRTDLLNRDSNYYLSFTHEMGHYLGLFHTFSFDSCQIDGDYCADTHDYWANFSVYPGDGKRTGCDGVVYQSVNFMDYYPLKYLQFTPLQIGRMRLVSNYSPWRANLMHSAARSIQPVGPVSTTLNPPPVVLE